MTIIRLGTTKKYSDGWSAAFGGKKSASAPGGAAKKKTKTAAAQPKAPRKSQIKASAKRSKPTAKKAKR